MNISNTDFLGGRYQFNADGNTGSVINQSVIKAADGGYIVLLGNEVKNSGTLTADNGSVVLGSAQSAMLDFYGNGLVKAKLSGDALNALVEQTGTVQADGGAVQLATNSRSSAVNISGLVQANSLVERNGVIRLEGGDNAKVSVSGNLSASGSPLGTKGGNIEVTGEQVALFKGAKLDASGDAGGGAVLVGGDYQGKNTQVYNSRTTFVDKDADINVDAKTSGNGGKVIVWADEITRYYGNISAKGGDSGGNGGFAEVSGKRLLNFLGKVDLSATQGVGGNLLLDPTNITLSSGADANTTGFTSPGDITEAFADDAGLNSIFNVNAGGSFAGIAAGSTITLQATNNITVSNTFNVATATGSADNSLVLQANNNIAVNAAVTTSGTGSITMNANADNTGGGNLAIGANITSQSGGITLTGANITRSAGNIASTGAADGNAGNINIVGTGTVNLGAATLTANGGVASIGNLGRNGGAITITGTGVTTTGAKSASGSAGSGTNQAGGNAGSVAITSTNGMNVGAISVSGGGAGTGIANGGNAGTITLNNSAAGNIAAGALTARTGSAIGTGVSGAGAININNSASGTIATGAINTSGNSNGAGGSLTLSSANGNITSGTISTNGGAVLAGNSGKQAGNITINSGGSFTATTIAATGSTGNGANQGGGHAGNITVNASGGIAITTITANGGNATATNGNAGNASNISLSNTASGNISTSNISARTGNATGTGTGGVAGLINVSNTSTGTIVAGNLSTQGGTKGNGGNISVIGQNNVTVGTLASAGGANVTGNAGRSAGSVNIDAGGNIIAGAITANGSAGLGTNQGGGAGGAVTLNAGNTNTITHSSINTSGGVRTGTAAGGNAGNVNIADNALLSANTTINATGGTGGGVSGNVSFGGTVNSSGSNRTLAVNTTAATIFNDAVGNTLALANLTTNTGGTTAINGGIVTTTGTQTYGDAVSLGATTNLNTTNSAITFNSSVNTAGNALTMAAGTGNITATNIANNFANVTVTSANNVSLRDANAIVLGASNISGTLGLRTVGAITQTGALSVGGTSTLNAGLANDITLNNVSNNFNTVTIISGRDVALVDANAMTVGASSVRTLSARALGGDLTLGGNIAATGTGSGTSITLASAQNFLNPGNFGLTPGVGSRWLVYSTNPSADTRGAGLIAASNFKQYNAVLGDTILGTGNGFVYSVAPTITANLSGTTNKIYDGTTTASITGLTLGQSGAIDGDTVNLSALTSVTYDDKNVGVGKNVSSNALSITGATNGAKTVFGYTLAAPNATGNVGTITQRAITVSAATDTKTYDGNTSSVGAPTVTSGSIVVGDTGSFSQTFDDKNAGTNKTLTAAGSVVDGNGGNNYAVTFVADNTGVINKANLTITANPGQSKTFGAVDPLPFTFTIGGSGLFGGDALTGALDRLPGEVVGNYAINQGTLDAGSNYTINYIGNQFTILAPTLTSGNGSPRDAAGLGSLLANSDRPTQSLAILNVAAPSAGDETDTENAAEACETNVDPKPYNPNTSIIFNFGIKLPKGVKPVCI
jgi:trimeric autotransporter adhesin